ncbi:hypothetical protein [Marinitoga sp. 38H-ov]|uniref:hypothetical protein n=1 Tax=Marinitoga sp. 38H-ov TaxID=1755814 RepID=UPI0013EA60F3|nr:hypothetical protein [Marinitoga sp. 38H-ov]KAF2956038.1 hypothetical protein AS160_07700 [Marinitoga sp. 38H-ov]
MPSILAHIIYSMKDNYKLWGPELYLGAQGPDIFFYVNNNKYREIGNKLHELSISDYKELMKNFPEGYYNGFISHMELDEKLHPIINIYYSESKLHTKFEYNFDEILSLRFIGNHFIENKWWKILKVNNIEKISTEFNRVLKNEFKINIDFKFAYKKMLKNLKLLFQYPYLKIIISKKLKLFGIDYLYPKILENDIDKLKHLEEEFDKILEGD